MSDSEQTPTAPNARFPQLVEQVFLRAERLTHGFLFRKRIKYNGDKKSLTRLWASWKKRYAVLSPGLLRLFPTENQTELDFGKCEEYSLQNASIRSHPYASTGYCLALYLRRNGSNLEITLAFPTQLTRDTWLKAFQIENKILAAEAAQSRERALSAFRDFFNMRLQLLNHDPQAVEDEKEEFSANVVDDYSVHYHRALHSITDAVPLPDDATESTDRSGAGEPTFSPSDEAVHTKHVSVTIPPSPAGGDVVDDEIGTESQEDSALMMQSAQNEQELQRIVGMSYLALPLSRLRAGSREEIPADAETLSSSAHSSVASTRQRSFSQAYKLGVPKMNIVIMVVGTRGDLAPFALLGKRLARDGHRVRIATHAVYREDVAKAGLEFYPLAGDPVKLSQFMVKTHGWVLPTTLEVLKEVPDNISMLHDIIYSCWPACTQPDPEDSEERPFVADAIISNPVTYGHIHCAEALGIPLHLMFPQPWVRTKAFPHPLACLSYQAEWSAANYLSYEVVERLMWLSVEPSINSFRSQLGLEPIRRGEHGWNMINSNKVPFACMFSPHLVSRPKDWENTVDIVGNFFPEDIEEPNDSDNAPTKAAAAYTPSPEIAEWLQNGRAPIFVGFGSMVIQDKSRLLRCIVEASAVTGARVLFQSGWTQVTQAELRAVAEDVLADLESEPKCAVDGTPIYNPLVMSRATSEQETGYAWRVDNLMCIGPCPHEWLFEHVSAVVHHGGAGTTAAGLRAGKPTMICPFFGDQPFWGEMVFRAGVGPLPCPASDLTTDILAESFRQLQAPQVQEAAVLLGEQFKLENGVESAVDAFYRHLPLESMLCDVSIFLGRSALAEEYCATCSLKLCKRVSDIVHNHQPDHARFPCCHVSWGVKQPTQVFEGLVQGFGAATHELVGGLTDAVMGQFSGKGITDNVRALWQGLVLRPSVGGMYLMKKVYAGYLGQKHIHSPSRVISRRRPQLQPSSVLIDEKTVDDIVEAVEHPRGPTAEPLRPADSEDDYDFLNEPSPSPAGDAVRTISTDSNWQSGLMGTAGNVLLSLRDRLRSAVSGSLRSSQSEKSGDDQTLDTAPVEPDAGTVQSESKEVLTIGGESEVHHSVDDASQRESVHEYQWLEIVTELMQSFSEEETNEVLAAYASATRCLEMLHELNKNQSRFLTIDQVADLLRSERGESATSATAAPASAFKVFRQLLARAQPAPQTEADVDLPEADPKVLAKHVVAALAGSNSVIDFVDFACFYMSMLDGQLQQPSEVLTA